jgi:hypothetical protein
MKNNIGIENKVLVLEANPAVANAPAASGNGSPPIYLFQVLVFSYSQISPIILSNRLAEIDFIEYFCFEPLAFELPLNSSINCFFVHFLNAKPGDEI